MTEQKEKEIYQKLDEIEKNLKALVHLKIIKMTEYEFSKRLTAISGPIPSKQEQEALLERAYKGL